MTRKRIVSVVLGIAALILIAIGAYFVYEKVFQEIPACGITGRYEEGDEEVLRARFASEVSALEQAGIRYRLSYSAAENPGDESELWIVVAAKDVQETLDITSDVYERNHPIS